MGWRLLVGSMLIYSSLAISSTLVKRALALPLPRGLGSCLQPSAFSHQRRSRADSALIILTPYAVILQLYLLSPSGPALMALSSSLIALESDSFEILHAPFIGLPLPFAILEHHALPSGNQP